MSETLSEKKKKIISSAEKPWSKWWCMVYIVRQFLLYNVSGSVYLDQLIVLLTAKFSILCIAGSRVHHSPFSGPLDGCSFLSLQHSLHISLDMSRHENVFLGLTLSSKSAGLKGFQLAFVPGLLQGTGGYLDGPLPTPVDNPRVGPEVGLRLSLPPLPPCPGVHIQSSQTVESSGLYTLQSILKAQLVKEDKDAQFYCELNYRLPSGNHMKESREVTVPVFCEY